MKILRDIWIMLDTGVVLYSRVFSQMVNDQLFGALMSALHTYAKEIATGGLTHFQLSNNRFYLIRKGKYLFIANSSPDAKEKKALEELNTIADKFLTQYGDVLQNWDSDVNVFSDFDKEIQSSIEEVVKKFEDSFW